MNKSKEKHHHPPEEAKPAAKITEPAAVAPVHHEAKAEAEAKPAHQAGGKAEQTVELTDAQKLQKSAQEIDQLKDQLLRLRADFENYRKRVLREKGEIYENANEALMLELLPALDHLQIAVKSARESKTDRPFQEGLQLILDQLMNVLSKYGLAPFNSGKQPFDYNFHEAISSLPSETDPEGVVITQGRQGYKFKNKLLRPAQVVVSSGKPAPTPPETNNQPAEE